MSVTSQAMLLQLQLLQLLVGLLDAAEHHPRSTECNNTVVAGHHLHSIAPASNASSYRLLRRQYLDLYLWVFQDAIKLYFPLYENVRIKPVFQPDTLRGPLSSINVIYKSN